MFDNLRELSDDSFSFDEAEEGFLGEKVEETTEVRLFGMTSGQRFVLSILFLAMVFVLGTTCLLVTQKIWPY